MNAYLVRPRLRSETHKKGTRAQLSLHLKDWLKRPLDEVTRSMVVSRHQELAHVPVAANHTLKRFRTIWNHARRTVDLPECPTRAIEWYEERPDGRTIGDLREWRERVGEVQNPIHAAFYWLLLYTGLRKTEAITLDWKQVLPDRIHLPMTKNGRSFDLPLVARHHEILEPLRRYDRRWVFPSPQSSTGHVKGPEVLPWSPHAHRRTFATVAVEAGILEEIVGRLLNHTPMSVTGQRYALPSLEALRPAMQTTCEELDRRLGIGGLASG
jgi:integrase